MAGLPVSVGDIITLSQTAWRIGRAFTQGKKSAPSEFAEVEREANGLSDALQLVAETLHSDGSILSRADSETKAAVYTILESARTTLEDLESFVQRYQVIKKRNTNGGFVVERSWSEVIMANYKVFKWTTEGGDITDLRNILQMHTNTLNLTMQALQSRSLARLEKTVMPMAENIASIHDQLHGDLGNKIDDLHRIIMAVANSTPSLVARDRAIDSGYVRASSCSSIIDSSSPTAQASSSRLLEAPPAHHAYPFPLRHRDSNQQEVHITSITPTAIGGIPTPREREEREDSAYFSPEASPMAQNAGRMDWAFETGSPSSQRDPVGVRSRLDEQNERDGALSASPTRPTRRTPQRETPISSEHPPTALAQDELERAETPLSVTSSFTSRAESYVPPRSPTILPPPAMPPEPAERQQQPATPLSILRQPGNVRRDDTDDRPPSPLPHTESIEPTRRTISSLHPTSTIDDSEAFEKQLFNNAAILCDVRATSVEYTRFLMDEPDPRYNTEMVSACKAARICVVRKRENREHGGTKVVTSIWTLSTPSATDKKAVDVRLQQKLHDVFETVPYCSFFEAKKVSLPPSSEGGQIGLKFHTNKWGEPLKEEKQTNWINYVFASEPDASAFQSAIFGRMLLGSFRTNKTTVIKEGLKGAFAFEEQFANIETLRLWEDDGIATPGAAGGVMALMHISSSFGDGWARWWINSSKQQVRVKPDGPKHAKVKGIDITVVRPGTGGGSSVVSGEKSRSPSSPGGSQSPPLQRVDTMLGSARSPGRKVPMTRVTGVRIEFKTGDERDGFVTLVSKVQERMLVLPAL